MQQVSAAMNLLRTRLLFPAVEVDGDYNAPASDGRVVVNAVSLASTVFLIHSDGPDLSTDMVDSSPSAHVISNGGVYHSVNNKKFGTTAIWFNGTDSMSVPPSTDFNFGADNFTIHFWIQATSYNFATAIMKVGHYSSSSSFSWMLTRNGYDGKIQFNFKSDDDDDPYWGSELQGTISPPNDGNNVPLNTGMDHVAVVRNGTSLRLYINGTLDAEYNIGVKTLIDYAQNLMIGATYSATKFQGYLDELHILKGVELWDGPFTPPTAPNFKAPGDATVILPVGTQGLRRQTQKGDTGIGNVIIKDSDLNILRTLTAYRELSDLKFDSGSWVTK